MRLRSVFTSFAAAGTIAAAISGTDLEISIKANDHNDALVTSAPTPMPRPDLAGKGKRVLKAPLPEMVVPVPTPRPAIEEMEQIHLVFSDKTNLIAGYADYCKRIPSECLRNGEEPQQIILDEKTEWSLNRINKSINARIQPISDKDQYGQEEFWTIPEMGKDGIVRGDCEDYVLTKKKELALKGVPLAAMMIVIVRDLNDQGHAVLAVRTDKGDMILDNLNDELRLPAQTGYKFLKATSLGNDGEMVALKEVKPRPDPIGQLISRLQP